MNKIVQSQIQLPVLKKQIKKTKRQTKPQLMNQLIPVEKLNPKRILKKISKVRKLRHLKKSLQIKLLLRCSQMRPLLRHSHKRNKIQLRQNLLEVVITNLKILNKKRAQIQLMKAVLLKLSKIRIRQKKRLLNLRQSKTLQSRQKEINQKVQIHQQSQARQQNHLLTMK